MDGAYKDAGCNCGCKHTGYIGSHSHREDHGKGIFIHGSMLRQFGRGGYAGNPCDPDDRIEVQPPMLVPPIHHPSAKKPADCGNSQGHNTQDEDCEDGWV